MNIIKTSFSAVVELPKNYNNEEVTVDVMLSKGIDELTYDEVEDAIYDKVDKEYGIEHGLDDIDELDDNEFAHILSLVVNDDDGESYPVLSESMDDSELKASKAYSKYLVLPNAVYSLTPEAKLWAELKSNGIIDDDAPFDFEKYHKIISSAYA